ncbi:NUDIX domain-containing protein [Nocardia sp. alder85J]|uniref:NUDIX domain-containing protein n=1 Tax=Nocardia sp. alder85J TaxID=2862949 RepID=UPI001CD2A63A|nr:NUDIX domain-containing protein [Nocardia sp. alder85J]MCX4098323.1 NUDIX domain-containing protein [Nocardia sp. alder85J]
MQLVTATITDLVAAIVPWDDQERKDISVVLGWLRAADGVFRRDLQPTPAVHLYAYAVVVDPIERRMFLGRHHTSGRYLPMSGRLDRDELPFDAVGREVQEELGTRPVCDIVGPQPFLLTINNCPAPRPRSDVMLWHVLRGHRGQTYRLDPAEFDRGCWWDLDPYGLPDTDPQIRRFLAKLDNVLQPAQAL